MAQKSRQTKLFAAEDYTVVYESYVNANFQAFDYDTIRTAMVDYVRNNYPENYNDWIESAEFVSLLDVVAQFGHNLAFRVDLNTRNNFLSTATKQESIFKLAEFLSYQPRRNVPAYGEMKVVAVKTNEAVIGSAGTSLGGNEIRYEVTNNVNNIDDFIAVMNAVFQNSNQFGSPKKQAVVDSIPTEFYDTTSSPNQIKFDVNGTVLGSSQTFNIINSDYNTSYRTVEEKSPNPINSFGLYYKRDGKGIGSNDTGFFFGVKQGSLQFEDFTIDEAIDGLTLDINVNNINHTDVWVQTVDDFGAVVKEWTKVRELNSNVIYNELASGVRDIFSVKTRTGNQISIQFPDRNFGNLPKDTIRVWYRTSVNSTYVLRPDDLTNKKISLNYTGIDGNTYTATFTLQLKKSVSNASSNESLDSIKENAPKNYAAQDRMITAQDYNSLLSLQSGNVLKLKGINRTFSGHSRYSRFNDPTGEYNNLYIYADNGSITENEKLVSVSASVNEIAEQIFEKYVRNILNNDELISLYYSRYKSAFDSIKNSYSYNNTYRWNNPSETPAGINSGYLVDPDNNNRVVRVGPTVTTYASIIEIGAICKFTKTEDNITTTHWAKVVDIFSYGLGLEGIGTESGKPTGIKRDGTGAITLDSAVPDGSILEQVYPAFNRRFVQRERDLIVSYLKSKRAFALKYDYIEGAWNIIPYPDPFDSELAFPDNFYRSDDSWTVYFDYTDNAYTIYLRTIELNFYSPTINLGNINNERELGKYTSKAKRDRIIVLTNSNNELVEQGIFYVYGYDKDAENTYQLALVDSNADSRPDNPDVINTVMQNNTIISDVRFEWEHIAADNQVVDPSFTNIIDIFVLSRTYDTAFKNWLNNPVTNRPVTPTSYELSKQFMGINSKKAMSDTVVFKPVKYKPLFGKQADQDLQARFRVIKLVGSNITDTDIKVKTVEAIKEYFDINNWDFGETFYFTELAAFVHKKLAGFVSSFVIVPQGTGSVFGDMFQYTPNTDELIIPDVTTSDIDIIESLTDENIRAGQ